MIETVINREIPDPIVQARFTQLQAKVEQVLNYRTTFSRLTGGTEGTDPRRDVQDECGHPKTEDIQLTDYQHLYDRNGVAKKANDLYPNHCWQVHPTVYEDEDPEKVTKFEKAVADLGKELNGESWYKNDEGSPFWEYIKRADRLCGIGHYGTILVGVSGEEGKDLSQPLAKSKKPRELIYAKVFTELQSPVKQYDKNSSSPRYGMPEVYQMQFDDVSEIGYRSDVRPLQGSEDVHWTRVIHVTDELGSSEVQHIPRLLASYDRYTDLGKLYGGSAEMYWKGAFPGFHFGTHPQLGGDVEVDVDSMKSMVEEWLNGLQRSVITSGYAVDSLSPQVVDPTPQINTHIEAICIEKDCPKRIFTGSERGELASSQDSDHWDKVVDARRRNHLTPRLIVPVVNRLVWLGVLPVPSQGFGVEWPEVEKLSPMDRAKMALLLTQAIAAFLAGNGEMVLPLPSFLTLVLGFTAKESSAIIEVLESDDNQDIHRQEKARADELQQQQQSNMPQDRPEGLADVAR